MAKKRVPGDPKKQKKRDFWQKSPAILPFKTEMPFFRKSEMWGPIF